MSPPPRSISSGAAKRLDTRCARTPAVYIPSPPPERLLPEGRDERRLSVALVPAPGVVHQQVEPALLALHALEKRFHVGIPGVIDDHRDPDAASCAHRFGRLFDGAGQS